MNSLTDQQQLKLVLRLSTGQQQEFALGMASVNLGRATTNDIVVSDAKASRNHARIELGPEGLQIADLGSSNGTRVNDVPVQRATLKPGDVITIGDSVLRLEMGVPQIEPDVTLIHSEADLDMTLAQATLAMNLTDTHSARLAIHQPGKTWEVSLHSEAIHIGRGADNTVVLNHAKVSRNHARIERRGDSFILRDLDSTNGTWIGSQRITEHILLDGDTFRIGDAQLVFKRGFTSDDLTIVEMPARSTRTTRRPVVIVPGLMGSELWLGSEKVWPNTRYLFTRPDMFRMPAQHAFEPRSIVREVVIVPNLIKLEQYNRLGDYLEEGLGYEREKDLLEFAYDWRQDVRESARRLSETIDNWGVTPPITLIAHSLGCLVSRYYVERLGGKSKIGRVIFLGGPHYGVPEAITTLLIGPNLLPFGFFGERLRRVIVTFPSVYQILPIYPCAVDQHGRDFDVFKDDSWVPDEYRHMLHAAREFREELGSHCSAPSISIFGYGLKTKNKIIVHRNSDGIPQKIETEVQANGDVTIPEVSTVLEGSEIHPVQQNHGSLYVDNDVKMRLKLELTR